MLFLRRMCLLAHDVGMTGVAVALSYFLRLGGTDFVASAYSVGVSCLALMCASVFVCSATGLLRMPWKFIATHQLLRIGIAASVLALVLIGLSFASRETILVPRTLPVIFWFVLVLLLIGPRLLYRTYRTFRKQRKVSEAGYRAPVVIVGTGYEAEELIRRLKNDLVNRFNPVGLIGHKRREIGNYVGGLPVLGCSDELDAIVERLRRRKLDIRCLIITQEELRACPNTEALLENARRQNLTILRPSETIAEFRKAGGPVQLAPVSIDDLLGRASAKVELSPLREFIGDRRVIVTGAGGSIGSELCRQIAAMQPESIMLFEQSELALYTISKELKYLFPSLNVQQRLGDVSDRDEVFQTFQDYRPNVVFHAAALKHVDLVEKHPVAAANTNALGTCHIADAASHVKVTCAVFISTDKAVNPVSILGATKRAGELYWAASDRASQAHNLGTRFVVVRFGNVLGSSGSVIPLFKEQLSRGGPITVTHPDAKRYFMTIPEAVTLVLMASVLGSQASDSSPTYILDMGQPVRILDLARRMIQLASCEPNTDIPIVFTGLRPGERLVEELEYTGEELRQTPVAGVQATTNATVDLTQIQTEFSRLEHAIGRKSSEEIFVALSHMIPEYNSSSAAPVLESIMPPSDA